MYVKFEFMCKLLSKICGMQELRTTSYKAFSVATEVNITNLISLHKSPEQMLTTNNPIIKDPQTLGSRLEVLKKLGSGASASVYAAKRIDDGEIVAIKVVDKRRNPHWKEEVQSMTTIKHPQIVHILGLYETNDLACLVIPYYSGGDLFERIMRDQNGFDEKKTMETGLELLDIVSGLHGENFAHLDIKPENFVYDADNKLVIIDLGNATPLTTITLDRLVGTPHYLAPEVAFHNRFEEKTDLWGIGYCMYTMLQKQFPCGTVREGKEECPAYGFIAKSIDGIVNLSTEGRSILHSMLDLVVARRPTIEESKNRIIEHLESFW